MGEAAGELNKERETSMERPIFGLVGNLALRKFPGMHKPEPCLNSEPQWKGHLIGTCHAIPLMTTLGVIIELSSINPQRKVKRSTAKYWPNSRTTVLQQEV